MTGRILFTILLGVSLCLAQQAAPSPDANVAMGTPDMKLKTNMYLGLDEGQAMQGVRDQALAPLSPLPYTTVGRLWQQRMVMFLTAAMQYRERLQFIMSTECDLNYSMAVEPIGFPATTRPGFTFYANDVEVNYSFGSLDMPWLKIAVGYFPVKYNPDARNLGEYLLRCGAYPNTIVTNFEFAMTRELGLRLSGFLGNPAIDQLRWDLMLTNETHDYPLLDGTISAIVSNDLFNMLDIGAGVSFQRLFPVDNSKTTPKDKPLAQFTDVNGVQQAYTFSSTKVMGRASINPLRFVPQFRLPAPEFFGGKPFFGKEDLKFYGEVAVLGTQDYFAYDKNSFIQDTVFVNGIPVRVTNRPGTGTTVPDSLNYYNNWKDRVPVMAGINLPTNPLISYGVLPFLLTKWLKDETGSDIRLLSYITLVPALASGVMNHFFGWDFGLDILALEFEWSSQRYPNSNYYAVNPDYKLPIPYPNDVRIGAGFGKPEPSKYSLYFKKSFLNNKYAISGLVGRDHLKPVSFVSPTYAQSDDFLQSKSQWWWTLRLSANF